MPTVVTRSQYLVINSITLATPRCCVDSLAPLSDCAPLVGANRRIPMPVTGTGVKAYRRWKTEARLTFGLYIFGAAQDDGTVNSDPIQGLDDNVAALKSSLGIASTGTGSLVTAVWHQKSGATKSAQVQVYGFYGSKKISPAVLYTTFDLVVPGGEFA